MTTATFLNLLKENPQKELIFEYQPNQFVPASYHITEVKNVFFESIDCGSNLHEEHQTVVQLWLSPKDIAKQQCMSAEKALKIFDIVDKVKPMKRDAELFFEYGHGPLRTSNYSIEQTVLNDTQIVFKLFVPATACKPALQTAAKGLATNSCC
jgi:hypothetical protein